MVSVRRLFYLAFIVALFFSPHYKWLKTKYPYLALGIATLISLPNLLWQYQHNFPVIWHITGLIQTQLKNVHTSGFILAQLTAHHAALLIWLSGLLYLYFSARLAAYRILGWIYLEIVALLVLFSGKSYYALGAYPMLMVVGGLAIEDLSEKWNGRLHDLPQDYADMHGREEMAKRVSRGIFTTLLSRK